MIRKSVLNARAAHGYAWLRDHGPRFGLDVQQLHLRPEVLDISNDTRCPLALAAPDGIYFYDVRRALATGAYIGTGGSRFSSFSPFGLIHRIVNVDKFVVDNGFDIHANLLTYALFRLGSDRDVTKLNDAWRAAIAASTAVHADPALVS
jgi:hypothetical protein